jgi:hypothetical protein
MQRNWIITTSQICTDLSIKAPRSNATLCQADRAHYNRNSMLITFIQVLGHSVSPGRKANIAISAFFTGTLATGDREKAYRYLRTRFPYSTVVLASLESLGDMFVL